MKKICAAGELLIDFTPCGTSPTGQQLFARNPGGAPANVLAMASRFGVPTQLCAVVGDDSFGAFLIRSVRAAQVSDRFIHRSTPPPMNAAIATAAISVKRTAPRDSGLLGLLGRAGRGLAAGAAARRTGWPPCRVLMWGCAVVRRGSLSL